LTSPVIESKEIEIDSSDWPRCDKCQMPVENFRATDHGDSLTLMAECHGKREVVTLPDTLWDSVIGTHMNLGPAFTGDDTNEE